MNPIALTVDIEDWFHTPAVTGSNFAFYPSVHAFMEAWTERYDYISEATATLLRLLRERQLTATFFIVADILDYYPGLVESILEGGHEIACHGLHHEVALHVDSKQPAQEVGRFEEETGLARERLQSFSGQPVEGFRAPGGYFGRWMFESLARLGFRYDSSLNPNDFFNKTDFSLRQIPSGPYAQPVVNGSGELWELPWSTYSLPFVRLPVGGGPMLRFLPVSYMLSGLRNACRRSGTVFYFHSLDIVEEPLPSLASKNIRRPFYMSTSGKRTRNKLMRILDTFQANWVTCKDLLSHVES